MSKPYLQLITINDAEQFFQLIKNNESHLIKYFPGTIKENDTLEKTKSFIQTILDKIEEKEYFPFGIFQNEKLIGLIQIKNFDWKVPQCELGYLLDKDFGGQGIVTKMVGETIPYCFNTLELKKIYLRIDPENIGSNHVALKNGFELEGVLRCGFRRGDGELVDVNYYGLLNQTLIEKPS